MSNKQSVLKFVLIATICSLVLIACQAQSATPQSGDNNTPVPQDTEVSGEATATQEPVSGEGLVTTKDNQPAPGLAAGWTVSEDRLDYVFTLKSGATFADGKPVDADAVVANFIRWFDPADPAHASGPVEAWAAAFGGFKGEKDDTGKPKGSFDGIEKVDNFTVLIHLNRPFDALLTTLAQPDFAIVSPATFKTQ